ncbi:HAD family hydrolase [Mangrovimonas sp. CR14]|uniref:HAD family hydrolase n=1 Tax=Mangrovimonas sp. CR14 TaxID=2706120 RepID=UPI0014205BF0|nr:HAD family hydrolase [Mangrovimonas sp. CR14]NIK92963.1 HAD family hydrolase [Mangrovimonas sp. CR14]
MNLSQIKLIATDMDGTLLNSKGQVSERFFELFKELKKHQIHFVAASGRQYYSITDKLNGITNDITIIAENGAITKQKEEELLLIGLSHKEIKELVEYLRAIDEIEIVLCGKKTAYIESENLDFIDFFKEFYHKYERVSDLTEIKDDDFLKIAVYCKHGSEEQLYPLVKHFEKDLQVKVSGEVWLDLSHQNANKGFALSKLQQNLGISKEETLVFGDYNNDLEMFYQAAVSVAMENAHPNLKKIATHTTKNNDENGVEIILEQLLHSKKVRE